VQQICGFLHHKIDHHEITEILLKVGLNIIVPTNWKRKKADLIKLVGVCNFMPKSNCYLSLRAYSLTVISAMCSMLGE
jgi:hypothetical protein